MKKGFTLIEVLVSIGLFSIIVGIAAGGFAHALRTQRQVAALIAAQSNAGLAIEQAAREMRTGYLFCHASDNAAPDPTCGCNVSGNVWTCSNLNFYNASEETVGYSMVNNAFARMLSGGSPQPITSANVKVVSLVFTIFGNTEGDHWTPRVTISMGVAPNSNDPGVANDVLNLETTVSAREIDCSTSGGIVNC